MENGKLRTRKRFGKGCCHKEGRLVRREGKNTEIVRYLEDSLCLVWML